MSDTEFYLTRGILEGLENQPKWGHLRDLHKAIKLCEAAMVATDPTITSLGQNLEVNIQSLVCSVTSNNKACKTLSCFCFVSNYILLSIRHIFWNFRNSLTAVLCLHLSFYKCFLLLSWKISMNFLLYLVIWPIVLNSNVHVILGFGFSIFKIIALCTYGQGFNCLSVPFQT